MPIQTLGFIGAGNMAEALVRAVLRARLVQPDRLIVSDPEERRRQVFTAELGLRATADNAAVVREAQIVVLAVKPQMFPAVAEQLRPHLTPEHLVISIMAGVPTAKIEAALGGPAPRVIRTMPNLPLEVGAGVTGVSRGRHATETDLSRACALFDAAGATLVLDEDKLHAVTAVSGSGPAYFFYFTEALIAGGVACGLSEAEASHLARHTALGAAKMMIEKSLSPQAQRQRVTSKGGTTQAAIEKQEALKVADGIRQGVVAAYERSRELGKA